MRGPDHYRKAEELLALADTPQRWVTGMATNAAEPGSYVSDDNSGLFDSGELVAAAQVHATLAAAAASLADSLDPFGSDDYRVRVASWREVVS